MDSYIILNRHPVYPHTTKMQLKVTEQTFLATLTSNLSIIDQWLASINGITNQSAEI